MDSHTAFAIVQILKDMAKKNTAVLLTIHQPSSEIFFLFDIVIYMKDGCVFYQGPASTIVDHFNVLGKRCPENYNPSDYVMTLSQVSTLQELESAGLMMTKQSKQISDIEAGSVNTNDQSSRNRVSTIDLTHVTDAELSFGSSAGFFKQLGWLLQREYQGLMRNKGALIGRFGVTIFLNLLFGCIFLNAGSRNNAIPVNYNTHFGCLTMATISSMFGSAQPTMLEFPSERPMFMREYVTGTCK